MAPNTKLSAVPSLTTRSTQEIADLLGVEKLTAYPLVSFMEKTGLIVKAHTQHKVIFYTIPKDLPEKLASVVEKLL